VDPNGLLERSLGQPNPGCSDHDSGAVKKSHQIPRSFTWTVVRCADEALQMHGGYGYMGEYDLSRFYRDAKLLEIYEGTKEIEKQLVARTLLKKRF
jgi:hypothetical protein